MAPHVASLLKARVSVVLDFPARTVEQRNWMRGILAETGASHRLHVLDVSEEECLSRLRDRNSRRDHPLAVTDEQFHLVSAHFAPPTPAEGLEIARHGVSV